MTKSNALKIFVPLVMLVVVGAIWLHSRTPQATLPNSVATSGGGAEFPLAVQSVDLQALAEHELPIIIDFGADECVPCKEMAPVLQTLNTEMQGRAIVQFVDVWKYPEGAEGFPVLVIPTQVFVAADGTPYVPSEAVSAAIPFYIYESQTTQEHLFTVHQGGLTETEMRLILADMGV